ncbi:uncharacterized protein K452DRAFT_282794 [Aplosporella prunicola CBS 121167]|uniref:Uncharacterized protein n=1 Tax=Aplosporella prunicola CBS 121167 TaxID=1176127 RepID=A0A6A6BRH2_9PEZI|nr:uncharacterized protein K452DRAFT_282794 [Aplosporella prunicola CBS 121167]KAF2146610.1 hypothetical protein K452DRAFT_282794 [Aplosporella prunicola CBS 121167]
MAKSKRSGKKAARQFEPTPPTSPRVKPDGQSSLSPIPSSPALSAQQTRQPSPSPSDKGSVTSPQQPTVEDYQSDTEKLTSDLLEAQAKDSVEKELETTTVDDQSACCQPAESTETTPDATEKEGTSEPTTTTEGPVVILEDSADRGAAEKIADTGDTPDTSAVQDSQASGITQPDEPDQVSADQAVDDQPSAEQPTVEQPSADSPTGEEPAIGDSTAEEHSKETAEEPTEKIAEAPIGELAKEIAKELAGDPAEESKKEPIKEPTEELTEPAGQPATEQTAVEQPPIEQTPIGKPATAPPNTTPTPKTATAAFATARNSPSLSHMGFRTETPTPRSPIVPSYPQTRNPYYPPSIADSSYSSSSMSGYPPPNYYYPGMPSYGMMPPHATPPYQPPYGGFGSPYGPYPGSPMAQRHNSTSSRSTNLADFNFGANGSAMEDESGDLLGRISSAIPDLNLLLSRYNETRSQLGIREELIRKSEAAQADAVKRKEDYIDSLTKQLEDVAKQHSSESNKLRLQIGDLEEKKSELEETIAEAEKSKKELEEVKAALEEGKTLIETEKLELERSTTEEKERLLKEFEDWKENANQTFESEKMALAVEFDRLQKEKEDATEREKAQMVEDHLKEKETMRNEFQRQKREMENSFEKVRKELESKLSGVQRDFEEALKKERESREVWNAERESLTKGWEDERETLQKSWDDQRELLHSQFNKEKEELRKEWDARQTELEQKAQDDRDAMAEEKERMKKEWDDDKASLEKVVGELKTIAGNWGLEKERMQKIIEGLGDLPELKGKGDAH